MKVAIFYTHCETLGHTTRIHLLARGLSERGHEVMIVSAGKDLRQIVCPGVTTTQLTPLYDRTHFLGGSDRQDNAIRVKQLHNALAEFCPDIFVTEYFPFGRERHYVELVTVIKALRKNGVKICASIGYPVHSIQYKKMAPILELYDMIMVHSPEEDVRYIEETYEELGAYKRMEDWKKIKQHKIKYTNYIYEASDAEVEKYDVVATRGGGSVCPKVITESLKAFKSEIRAIGGPASTEKENELFSRLGRNNTYVQEVDNVDPYIRECNVCISMAGYNTACSLLYHGKSCVIVPFKYSGVISPEQHYRAKILRDKLGAQIIAYDELSPEKICEGMKQIQPARPVRGVFDGLNNSIRLLETLSSK